MKVFTPIRSYVATYKGERAVIAGRQHTMLRKYNAYTVQERTLEYAKAIDAKYILCYLGPTTTKESAIETSVVEKLDWITLNPHVSEAHAVKYVVPISLWEEVDPDKKELVWDRKR